jgi:hypothetical protein
MQRWEYLVVFIEDSKVAQNTLEIDVYMDVDKYTQALNNYGVAGWELVSFEARDNGARAAFKRPAGIIIESEPIFTPAGDDKGDDINNMQPQ